MRATLTSSVVACAYVVVGCGNPDDSPSERLSEDGGTEPAFVAVCETYSDYAEGQCPELHELSPSIDYPGELSYPREILVTERLSEDRQMEIVLNDSECESAPWSVTLTPLESALSRDPFEGDHMAELCRSDGTCMPAMVRIVAYTPERRPRDTFWLSIDGETEAGSTFYVDGDVKPCLPEY